MSVQPARSSVIDLSDPELYVDGIPQEIFAELRAQPGLFWNDINVGDSADREPSDTGDGRGGDGFWAVTRFRDLVDVSRDAATFSSEVGHIQIYDIDEDARPARASMIDLDPPVHTRLRRLVSAAFTPKFVTSYRAAIRARVRVLLDQVAAAGTVDWVDTVAKPIPISVICEILGVPPEDHGLMIELSDHLVAGTSNRPLDPNAYGNTTDLRLLPFNSPAAHAINEYALAIGAERRAHPRDDLLTKLIQAEVDGEHLTDTEFANFFRLMIFAGNETTRAAMSHLALQMTMFTDEFNRVAADRTLVPTAVEEVVRYSSPILYFRRTATRDVELSGTQIAAGDKVVMWYAAANFDGEAFPDPTRFDVSRPPKPPNVSFGGGGVHFCLGASLARLELAELLDEMLDRRISVETVGDPTFVYSNFVNGIEHLEVRVGQRAVTGA